MRKDLRNIVRQVLIECPTTREDDFKLIYQVVNKITGGAAGYMMLSDVANMHEVYELPSFESITRARRRIQKEMPERKVSAMVAIRAKEEQEFRQEYRGA